jgi:hypothetical protein
MLATEPIECDDIDVTNIDLIVEIIDDTLSSISSRSIVSVSEMIDIFLDIRQLACEDQDFDTPS